MFKANTSAIWQQAAHTPPTNYPFLAAEQEAGKRPVFQRKKCWRILWSKKSGKWTIAQGATGQIEEQERREERGIK